ncbi:kinesin-like protein Klp5 [Geranomyces variabilis]|uniref:Kinesin-like protein Klp5 n=1 Tax=Geranomyces variabilis TaxID=109894 RepID=A0AAD5XLG5_9FUNG|nr:kinesin-like protein Klp5 [Geranomyces variabilis]
MLAGSASSESLPPPPPPPSSSAQSAIAVAVRVRPFLAPPAEQSNEKRVITVVDEQVLVFDPADPSQANRRRTYTHGSRRHKEIRYGFDRVFNEAATQQEVYEGTAKPLLDGVLNGFNATVFAYGATGCGKTHTITGTTKDPGIIWLTMRELFERINAASAEQTFETTVSYLEVYNEAIRDLLDASPSPESLDLREDDGNARVVVAGLSEHKPKNVDHVMRLLIEGNNQRTRASTEANAVSSRSHAVLQIHVRQQDRAVGVKSNVKLATLSIIDLAGSERASNTKNQGQRLIEGANINRSLLALGNCINALCSDRPNHIPYRDSKLTRLLKYSLGGNCRVVMITAVSASSQHYDETHNTLKYANRAKNIKTKVEQNTVDVAAHMAHYPKLIADLKNEVELLRAQLGQARDGGSRAAVAEYHSPARRASKGIRADAFDMLLRKVHRVFEKLDQRETEKCEALAEVEQNERKLSAYKTAVAALDPPGSKESTPSYMKTRADELRVLIEAAHAANVGLRHNANQARLGILRLNAEVEQLQTGPVFVKLSDEQKNRLRVEIQLTKLGAQNALLAKQVENYQQNLEYESKTIQGAIEHAGKSARSLMEVANLARRTGLNPEHIVMKLEERLGWSTRSFCDLSDMEAEHAQVDLNWDTGSEASEASDMSDLSDSDAGSESDVADSDGLRYKGSFLHKEMEAIAKSYEPIAPAAEDYAASTPSESSDEREHPTPPRTARKISHHLRGAQAAQQTGASTPPTTQKRRASPDEEYTVKKIRPRSASPRCVDEHDGDSESETGDGIGTPTRQLSKRGTAEDNDATPIAKPRTGTRKRLSKPLNFNPRGTEQALNSDSHVSSQPPTPLAQPKPRRSARQSLIPVPPFNRRESLLPVPLSSLGLGLAGGPTPNAISAIQIAPATTTRVTRSSLKPPTANTTSKRTSLAPSSSSASSSPSSSSSASASTNRAGKVTKPATRRPRASLAPTPVANSPPARARRASVLPTRTMVGPGMRTRASVKRLAAAGGLPSATTSARSSPSSSDDAAGRPKWK